VLHAFAAGVVVGELEGVVPVAVDAGQRDELELVAQRSSSWKEAIWLSSRFFFQLNEGEQL
jgi:hypothetical protein